MIQSVSHAVNLYLLMICGLESVLLISWNTLIKKLVFQTKKSKTKMPSLVKKWQSIQKELDEEEKSSSSDEDRDQLNNKRIEEWKQQQLSS